MDDAASRSGTTGALRRPHWLIWILWGLYAAAIFAVLSFDLTGDNATTNVVVVFFTFLGVLTLGTWYAFFSGLSRRTRFVPPLILLAAVAGFFTYFRIDHVTGEMLPVFAPRFAPKADAKLPPPSVSPAVQAKGVAAAATIDDFPQFLGPERLAAVEGVALERDWERHPPELMWRRPVGAGWSGFAVAGGRAVTLEQRGPEEFVTCYDTVLGTLYWSHSHEARYESVLGGVGPRSTPTIRDGRVYVVGATGWFGCLDFETGNVLWAKNLPSEFGISPEQELEILPFARSSSPLIVDELVVVPAGGPPEGAKVSLAAFDRKTGREVWRGGDEQLSHASPALATLAGRRQILCVNESSVTGHDPATGRELWRFDWPGRNEIEANNSQAVPVPPDRVFVSKGQGGGAKLVRLVPRDDGAFTVEPLWHNRRVLRTKFTNVALLDGYAYGLSDGILECVRLDTGERMWKAGRYKHGQLLRVGPDLLVLSEDGELVLIEATPERPNHVFGRIQAIDGQTWNTFAFAAPYALLRNAREAACYRLRLR